MKRDRCTVSSFFSVSSWSWTVGWLENQNFGKQFALRLEFCIDDEKTSQAKFQDNRRFFRGSADHLKFTCMKKVKILRFFSYFRFFSIFSRFEFFPSSLYQCTTLWIMLFQIFSVFYWCIEVPQCQMVYFVCNYSVLKWFFVYFRISNFFFVFPWAYINSCHHEIDFYKNSSPTTDIERFRSTVKFDFSQILNRCKSMIERAATI